MHQGLGAQADDILDLALLQPADQLGLSEAGIRQHHQPCAAGQPGHKGKHAPLELVLAFAQPLPVINPIRQRQGASLAQHGRKQYVQIVHLGPVQDHRIQGRALPSRAIAPDHRCQHRKAALHFYTWVLQKPMQSFQPVGVPPCSHWPMPHDR